MWKTINRNNRLFMLGNFLFALSYGLWMNLRQLHLGDLGATPAEIGTALGVVSLAGAVLPLPAGLLTDRFGAKRVIVGAWVLAILGTAIAAMATSWPLAGVGFGVFMLVMAANPATVSYVLLNVSEGKNQEKNAARVMAIVFASWPVGMIFAPALGGVIADIGGIGADLWLGALGFAVACAVFARAEDVRPKASAETGGIRGLFANRSFMLLAFAYPLVLVALNLGLALVPTFLEDVRGYSTGIIGTLFSVQAIGTLLFNYVVGNSRLQTSYFFVLGSALAGLLLIWGSDQVVILGLAFALIGSLSAMWLVAQVAFGRVVQPHQRGVALGITESLAYCAVALATWLAGQLYERTPQHDLPFMLGAAAITIALVAGAVVAVIQSRPRSPAVADATISVHQGVDIS